MGQEYVASDQTTGTIPIAGCLTVEGKCQIVTEMERWQEMGAVKIVVTGWPASSHKTIIILH